ncbi:DUF2911 domain-containing protein [uncultured Cyclobacterium sp.]|uniref:DUF2911 domain-containing protein n=1 Tax=uncultured Cyclobacterium sp. TaxID=453820 RepID=UPI0030EBF997|tara:strand:- start:29742 stop:30311 length:570 start_codon:yes stop_codon:yes gene_type:complete
MNYLKKPLFSTYFFVICFGVFSCSNPSSKSDVTVEEETVEESKERASPLKSSSGVIEGKKITVQYSAPSIKGRIVWGDLVPYGEIWRTGANEATNITFGTDVVVEGELVKAGKYSLFTIPKENEPWTVVLNADWDLEHGHFQYNEENDVLRVDVSPTFESSSQESLSIEVVPEGLEIKWEKANVLLNIE